MSDTITAALSMVYGVLSADATLAGLLTTYEGTAAIFQDIAPAQGVSPEWVVYGIQSPGEDTLSANAVRLLSRPMLRVLVSGPIADMANISAAYARVDALLQPSGGPLRFAGSTIACYRMGPLYLPEPELIAGKQWVNLGGLYRVEL